MLYPEHNSWTVPSSIKSSISRKKKVISSISERILPIANFEGGRNVALDITSFISCRVINLPFRDHARLEGPCFLEQSTPQLWRTKRDSPCSPFDFKRLADIDFKENTRPVSGRNRINPVPLWPNSGACLFQLP